MPANSSQQFDFVLSLIISKQYKTWVTEWRNTGPLNYVLLKTGTDINAFNKNIAKSLIKIQMIQQRKLLP